MSVYFLFILPVWQNEQRENTTDSGINACKRMKTVKKILKFNSWIEVMEKMKENFKSYLNLFKTEWNKLSSPQKFTLIMETKSFGTLKAFNSLDFIFQNFFYKFAWIEWCNKCEASRAVSRGKSQFWLGLICYLSARCLSSNLIDTWLSKTKQFRMCFVVDVCVGFLTVGAVLKLDINGVQYELQLKQ